MCVMQEQQQQMHFGVMLELLLSRVACIWAASVPWCWRLAALTDSRSWSQPARASQQTQHRPGPTLSLPGSCCPALQSATTELWAQQGCSREQQPQQAAVTAVAAASSMQVATLTCASSRYTSCQQQATLWWHCQCASSLVSGGCPRQQAAQAHAVSSSAPAERTPPA